MSYLNDGSVYSSKLPLNRRSSSRSWDCLLGRSRDLALSFSFFILSLLFAGCPNGDGIGGGGGNGEENGGARCGTGGFFCPEGFECDEESGECLCTPGACVEGSICDEDTGECICATDECCPEGYSFDLETRTCICASNECCPEDHAYDEEQEMCVCVADICCPPGFSVDAEGRCLCEFDEACGEGFYCDRDSGDCRCESNASCPDDAFCNDFGFCQDRAACASSYDCPSGQVCDYEEGFCVRGYCANDADCPWGRICRDNRCERGCESSDDCWLAQACVDGHCRGAICDRQEQCTMGEFCTNGSCVQADGEYCKSCDPEGFVSGCSADNACLTFVVEGMQESFCGVACDRSDPYSCPGGYSCGGTIVPCDDTGMMCPLPDVNDCALIEMHNEDPKYYCVTPDGDLASGGEYCAPDVRHCGDQPPQNETNRPGNGASCTTLCQDNFVCANVGSGFTCYRDCSTTGQCTGSYQCRVAGNGVDMVCAPP